MSDRLMKFESDKKEKFKGELSSPITIPPPPQPPTRLGNKTQEDYEKELNQYKGNTNVTVSIEHLKKLDLLCKKYNLKQDDDSRWLMLAYNLALDCVPGFEVKFKPDKRNNMKWSPSMHVRLYRDVERKRDSKPNYSSMELCRFVIKDDPWNKRYDKSKVKTLYNNYIKAKENPIIQMYLNLKSDKLVAHFAEEFLDIVINIEKT